MATVNRKIIHEKLNNFTYTGCTICLDFVDVSFYLLRVFNKASWWCSWNRMEDKGPGDALSKAGSRGGDGNRRIRVALELLRQVRIVEFKLLWSCCVKFNSIQIGDLRVELGTRSISTQLVS